MTDVPVQLPAGGDAAAVVAAVEPWERLVFPAGRYRWDAEVTVDVDHWGLRCQPDTVFEVPAGVGDGSPFVALATASRNRTADAFEIEHLAFDSPGRAAPGVVLGARNHARVDGLRYEMHGPLTSRPHTNGVKAFVRNPDGFLSLADYRQFNDGDLGGYGRGDTRIGLWVGPENHGTVFVYNPVLEGFPNNGCYVSRQPGSVVIDGGLLMNNNVSAVRLSGNVTVFDTTIVIDVDRYLEGPGVIVAPKHNTRGVWGDNRQAGVDGGLVSGASFILRSYRRCTGLVGILQNDAFAVHDCQFLLDATIDGVQAYDGEIEVTRCDFAGDSFGSTAGTGDITGRGNRVATNIAPGAVTIANRKPVFDWSRTHPATPDRPTVEG